MKSGTPIRPAGATAADVCQSFELSKDAQKLLQENMLPRPFLDLLIAHQHHEDATRFMAHALPRREGVWWSCGCARLVYGSPIPPKEAAALQLAEIWVSQPTDENRRAAYKAAEAAQFKNPAGLIGMAVFFSSGSLAPAGQGDVPAAPHLAPVAIANAILLASVMKEPAKAPERFQRFLALGFDVSNGKNRWK